MRDYWEEELDKNKVTPYQINPEDVIYYKKCVDRDYGSIWFEIKTKDNTVHKFNMPGH